MISSQPISFHRPVDLLGDDPMAPFASEIMQRAPNCHHLVHHARATIAKLVSQNPQTLHRSQCVLHRDPVGRQQAVEPAMSPMELSSIAPRPGGDHTGGSSLQSLKATVTQKMNLLRQTKSGSLGHFLIMTLGRHCGRTPQHPALADNEHILDGVAFLAPAIKPLLFAPMLWPR